MYGEAGKYVQKLYFRRKSIPAMEWSEQAAVHKDYSRENNQKTQSGVNRP